MKRKIARILTTFVLVLCVCIGFSACKKSDDNNNSSAEAKVTSFAVELVNDNYELTNGTITKTYGGGSYQLTSADFKVVATLDNDTTKELSLKTDTADGYTLSSTVKTSDIKGDYVQVGDYTYTFGYGDLESKTINYKVEKANFDINSLTWSADELEYNGKSQTPTITNAGTAVALLYDTDNGKTQVNATGEKYTAKAKVILVDTRNYNALTASNEIEHEWVMKKGDLEFPEIEFVSRTYNTQEQEPELDLDDDEKALFEVKFETIGNNASSKDKATNAGTYPIKVKLTYIGSDKDLYNSSVHEVETAWTINKLTIDTSKVTLKCGETYTNSLLTYDGVEKTLVFDLSSLAGFVEDETCPKETTATGSDVGTEGVLPSTGSSKLINCSIVDESSLKATNVGKYSATISFSINTQFEGYENFCLSNATVTKEWKINPKSVRVTAPTIASGTFVYGVSADDIKTNANVAGKATLNLSDFLNSDGGTDEAKSELYTSLQNLVRFKVCKTESATAQGIKGNLDAGTYYLVPVITDAKSGNYCVIVDDDSKTSFEVAKKELNGSLTAKTVEYSKAVTYTKSDFSLSGFENGDTIDDVTIANYEIKYKSTADGSEWSSDLPTELGTYSVKLENIEDKNYTIVVREGMLTITKCTISLSVDDISWQVLVDTEQIIPSYNTTTGEWETTIEETETGVSSYQIKITGYTDGYDDEILNIAFTDKDGGTLSEIKNAGTYDIKANVSLKDSDNAKYNFTACSYTLKITIVGNPFETTGAGSGASPISVTVTTAAEEEEGGGEPSEEGLTFNAFANKTEFKYGDKVSFTLANDSAADASGVESAAMYGASPVSENLVNYKVEYNGVLITPVAGVYTITFASTTVGTGLVIKKVVSSGDVELFVKSNFTVKRTFNQAIKTVRINNVEYIDGVGEKWKGYYKLSENQTSITVTIDESLVGLGLYAKLSGNGSEFKFDTSNSVTIPVSAAIASGGDLVLSILKGGDVKFQTTIISWVEVKDIYVISYGLQGRKNNITPCFGKTIINAVGVSWTENNSFITDIGVTFEDGYGKEQGWSYVVTFEDGTPVDYTKAVNGTKDIIYVINIYHNDEFQYSTSVYARYDFIASSCDSYTDRYVYVDSFTAEKFSKEDLSNNNITSSSTLVKKSGTNDEYSESVKLTEELTSVDWKVEFVIFKKTYTFIKKFVVVKQDSTFKSDSIKQGAEETQIDGLLTYDDNSNFGVSGYRMGIIRGDSHNAGQELNIDEFVENYFDASATDKGVSKWNLILNDDYKDKVTITKKEYLFKNGLVFLKFTLSETVEGGTNKESYIILKLCIGSSGLFDDDTDATFEILDASTFTESVITPTDDVFYLTTGTQFMIKPSNWDVTILFEDANGEDVGDDEEFVLTTAGVYTLTITSVDCSKTKTYILVVTGEDLPMLEFALKTENGEDKTLLYEEDAGSGEARADFKMGYDTVNNSYKFFTYLGDNHGLKVTTIGTKRYATLTSFRSMVFSGDSIYTLDGEQLVIGVNGFNLEILTDENNSPYIAFYSFMNGGEYSVPYYFYVYLCDEIVDWELIFEGETSGGTSSAQDKQLILELENAIYGLDVTEESDFEIKAGYGYCLVGFTGKENHGLKIYNDDDLGKYITLKSWVSGTGLCNGVYMLEEGEEEPTQITQSVNLILELLPDLEDEIYATSFYTKMFADTYEYVMVYLFFCDEADLPEDFFDQGGGEYHPGDYGPDNPGYDPDHPGGDERPNSLTPIVKVALDDFDVILQKITDPDGNEYYGVNIPQISDANFESEDNIISWYITLTVDQNTYSSLSGENATYTINGLSIDQSLYETGTLTFKDYYYEWNNNDDNDDNDNNDDYTGQTITNGSLNNISLKVITDGSNNPYASFTLKNEETNLTIACIITFISDSSSSLEDITE